MNDMERKVFWETLCSLTGENMQEDAKKLCDTINYPDKLYRYRPITISTIEALKNNKLYFSTADYYDDPFDTFINVRIKDIKPTLLGMNEVTEEELAKYLSSLFTLLGNAELSKDDSVLYANAMKDALLKQNWIDTLEEYFRNIRNEIKKDTFSVCFSESPFNETLWLKYAEQHKGFAVEYDLVAADKLLCGKQEKCKNCGVNILGSSLYPMYYSEDIYDATRFAQFLAACKMFEKNLTPELFNKIMSVMGNQAWEREKIMLIKKLCHKYDAEWRMIIPGKMNPPVMREWIPSAVYLGLNMKKDEVLLVKDIAKSAGIETIYKCYITDNGKISAVELP